MIQGTHRFPPMERVIYGVPLAEALARGDRAHRRRTRSMCWPAAPWRAQTDVVETVRGVLGNRLAGVCAQDRCPHAAHRRGRRGQRGARGAKADALLTVGGGSVTDAAKMVGLCLGNDVTEPEQLDKFRARISADGKTDAPACQSAAAALDRHAHHAVGRRVHCHGRLHRHRWHGKESYAHPLMMPRTVILDPAATVHTPEWLFLSTGIRAVDHAVEDICSINRQPFSDGTSLHALRLLARGLRGGEGGSGRPGGAAGLPARRLDVDHGLAERA